MVKIVVDSGCDVKKEIIENEGYLFESVPLNLQCEDRVYIDDEHLDMNAFVHHMESSPVHVKTSAPSPALFMNCFGEGDRVFVVTLSSKLSGTYSAAMTAKRMYVEECGKKFIHVFDSLSASVGGGLVAMKIAEFAKTGLDNIEIVEQVNHFIKHMRTYFLLDRFDTLVKTGRINPYIAKMAAILNIKPICGDDFNGGMRLVEKARGQSKAMKRLVQIIKETTPDIENRIVHIAHVRCYEKALAFKEELLNNLRVKDVLITETKGLATTYASLGGVIVAL